MPNYPDKRKWALIIGYICAACLIFIIVFTIFNISSTLISTTESITQSINEITGEIGGETTPNATQNGTTNPNSSPSSENSGAPLFGIKNIKIDGFVGDLRLIEGDEFTVLCNKTAKNYTIATNHETLEISSNSDVNAFLNHFTGRKVPKLTITIPKNLVLDNLEINLAPSSLFMENISAENFTLQSPVSSGKIKGGSLNNAQIKTGLGTIKISAELKGNCSIETGIGETKIEIQGEKSDYYISAENVIGTLKIDGENFSGETGNPSAENKIKLKNAIGETTLKFPH